MLYTLIIITALSGTDHRSGGNVHTESVPGFTTEQACLNAARNLKFPTSHRDFQITYATSCVKNTI